MKKAKATFAKNYEELEKLTQEFEQGELDLEESVPKLRRGLELARELKNQLSVMENEIKTMKKEYGDIEDEASDSLSEND